MCQCSEFEQPKCIQEWYRTLLHTLLAFGSILFTFAAIKLLMTQIEGLQLDMGLTRVKSLSVLEE